ncbi:hypothetical protein [uncultured Piscinibacter sp.]|mgnify:CR=1 FL=1|uniref:hypothetical protein n=1 Tax=uncultured Piscinibacter sp. TaxID=1131835 RepID=UPI00262C611D|nr:hypothetical protein [uncultured Piscinibacter sp.]
MINKVLASALLACSALVAAPAFAHGGGDPKHGGVVQTASDLSFELVAGADGATIYVEDHGKPLAPAGMSGKLTVLNGAEKSEAALAAAGDRLEAKGVRLAKGAKVVATITTASQKAITVRFTVR